MFKLQPIAELLEKDYPDIRLTSPGLLTQGGRMLLGGDTGIGKSMLVLTLAYELALGIPAFGVYPVKHPLNTAYVQFEVAAPMLQERAAQIAQVHGVPDNLWQASPRLFTLPQREDELAAELEAKQIEVLILDPLYTLLEGSEISIEDIAPVRRSIDMAFTVGVESIIIVSHTKKASYDSGGRKYSTGNDDVSGHKSLVNWADTIGMVSKRGDRLQLDWTKTRNVKGKLTPQMFEWQDEGLPLLNVASDVMREEETGRAADVILKLSKKGEMTQADLRSSLKWSEATTRRVVRQLIEAGKLEERKRGVNIWLRIIKEND